MTARRAHPSELRDRVRARYAEGDLNLRELAEMFSLPWTTAQNMVKGRKSPEPHAVTRVDSTGRAAHLRRRRAEAAAVVTAPPVGVVAAARAERDSGRPLVVETLEQRLFAAIPGAYSVDAGVWVQSETRWSVNLGARAIAHGASQREAIDRAIALRGAR
jgi:hypothetical protein